MSHTAKASTQAIVKAAGLAPNKILKSSADEHYRVYEAFIALSNNLYRELGKEVYERGQWPADSALLEALRNGLSDNYENYAGQAIAHFLLRTGCRREDTLNALHPWDAIAFNWKKAGYTADDIRRAVIESGIADDVAPDRMVKIAAWIANPQPITSAAYTVPSVLFGDSRPVYSSLRDNGFTPTHDELFAGLVASVNPRIAVANIKQLVDRPERFSESKTMLFAADGQPSSTNPVTVFSDQGAHWTVQYEFEGKQRAFFAQCNGTWMNVAAVLKNFDAFMSSLGRPERAYQFAFDRGESSEHGFFIAANADRFAVLLKRLSIPIETYPVEPT